MTAYRYGILLHSIDGDTMRMVVLALSLLSLWIVDVRAQCDSLNQVQLQLDTMYATNEDGTMDRDNIVLSNEIVPYFSFDYQQDSCRVRFRIGEFSWNHHWIHLQWCDGKVYNFDPAGDSAKWDYTNAQLSAISRTRTFQVQGGDTLEFFRELFWFDNATNSYNPDRIRSDDDLSFSVELVDAADDTRVMLLDTMSLKSSGGTNPCLYMWRPVVARIGHIVAGSVGTISAYIRVNVAATGSSGSRFMRYDNMRLALSPAHLTDSGWNSYVASVASANNCTQSCTFSAGALSSPRRVQVSIRGDRTMVDRIDVVDLNGNVIDTTALPVPSPYTVNVAASGLYIVPGYRNASVVCTQLIYVP